MPRLLPIILGLALIIYALIDCVQTPEEDVPPGLPKTVWVFIILLVPVIGAGAWLLVSRLPNAGGGRVRRSRPVAPDDDAEFLANLDWQARKAHYERLRKEREAREGGESGESRDGSEDKSGDTRTPEV